MAEPSTELTTEQRDELLALVTRWIPDEVLAGLRAIPDDAEVRKAAAELETAKGSQWHARQVADGAARDRERTAALLAEKQGALDGATAHLADLKRAVADVALDDPQFAILSGQGWGVNQKVELLTAERDEIRAAHATAQQHATETEDAAVRAEARVRIADLNLKKALHRAAIDAPVAWACEIVTQNAHLVQRARDIRNQFEFAHDPGLSLIDLKQPHDAKALDLLVNILGRRGVMRGLVPGQPDPATSGNGQPVSGAAETSAWVDALPEDVSLEGLAPGDLVMTATGDLRELTLSDFGLEGS